MVSRSLHPRIGRALALLAGALLFVGGCGTGPDEPVFDPEPYVLEQGDLPPLPETPDNPLTVPGVQLGRLLFFDPILSFNGTQSCATCHIPAAAFSDPRPVSVGADGVSLGTRNAPTIVNPAWSPEQFRDGRAASLEDQARVPVPSPIEMNLPWDQVEARLAGHPEYPALFEAAFGTIEVSEDRAVKAIAQFQRTFVSYRSKWDRKVHGEDVFTDSELRGEILFRSEQAECFHCHGSLLFTDNRFHDIGLDLDPPDAGRMDATGDPFDRGKFRTPTLRNVEVSAPYMHDGRFATLEEVVDHYAEGVQRSPNLDPLLGVNMPAGVRLTEQERADLVAFLRTLTDEEFLANPEFRPPRPGGNP